MIIFHLFIRCLGVFSVNCLCHGKHFSFFFFKEKFFSDYKINVCTYESSDSVGRCNKASAVSLDQS